ncbi:MAG: glycoside hydrolase family 3 C-terminal domain-containing protein, partial [Bifidobacteriaceae bacterium]|nr:glycoside hydrolase family 3 C-terminal domain-containing protein [Bifidobacteriaceae bacterium]
MKPSGPSFDDLIARLDLTRKVLVLTGRDFWSTWPLPEIGLRSMVMSDGPSGVRGPVWDERSPSLNLPSASALASAWDPDLARAYGAVAAAEARRKGVDVVLGPTINLHRSPLGGRHFEAFSEDPVLTAQLAAAYITGLQTNGVGATPKHYVANDSETERFTLDAEVSARALRELYLLPFEEAVVDADAWLVMSAYNAINGATATENALLAVPLNEEWEFDGVVVSDWGAVRSINAARHEQDLAMPGPDGPWGSALVEAVESGDVPRQAVDRKVRRLLQLAARVGALEGFEPPPAPQHVDGPSFARRAAAEGTVLLANDGILPVTTKPKMIAVIGHNALVARSQGGGSATVVPERVVSPLEGIQEAFPDAAIRFALGAVVQSGVSALPLGQLRNPSTGGAGARVRFLDATGEVIFEEDRFASSLTWLGSDVPLESSQIVELTTDWTPSETRTVRLGFSGVGHGIIRVRGAVLLDCVTVPVGTDLGAAILTPPSQSAHIDVEAGVPLRVTFELERATAGGALAGALSLTLGLETEDSNPDELIEQAEAAAREADLVVLVVGTNAQVESEGHDRTDLRLPGHQDRLAQAVLSANRRTVVVVNAGAPVELPWASRAAAL